MPSRPILPFLVLSLPLLHTGVVLADEPPPLQVAAPAPPAPAPSDMVAPAPPTKWNVPEEEAPKPYTGWLSAFVIGVEGGAAFVPGRSPGGFGRFILLDEHEHHTNGTMLSVDWVLAMEAWRAKSAGGGALPLMIHLGFDTNRVFASLNSGYNLCTFDIIDGKSGGGVFSPRLSFRLGVRLADVYVALDTGVQRRWMWGLDDITLFTVGLSLGFIYREKPAIGHILKFG